MKHNALYTAVLLGMSIIGASAAVADDQNVTGSGPSFNLGNAKLTVGGFLAAEAEYRNRDEQADIGSKWAPIFGNNDAHNMNDFRMTARQSRLSLLVQGPSIDGAKAEGYYEGDFLGAAVTANSNESNSYTPRIRQIFADYTMDNGFQVLAGQAWSLVTQNKSGIQARKENVPMTIDAQYVPGFTWTRNPQLRLTQKFDDMLTGAISLESPQALPTGNKTTGTTTTVSTFAGGSLMNSTANYTVDNVPDVVAKVAIDPGFGHFEVLGMSRHFRDRVDVGSVTNGHNNGANAASFGINAILPVVPKMVDISASVLSGKGIGRYGSAQLPDYTFKNDGSISSIKGTDFLLGVVGHATPDLDLYGYVGQEKDDASYDTGTFGYGNPANSNAGCDASSGACTGNVNKVTQYTFGGWYKFYRGEMGYLSTGLQFSHTKYDIFADAAGHDPKASMNVVTASFRYYPFQK